MTQALPSAACSARIAVISKVPIALSYRSQWKVGLFCRIDVGCVLVVGLPLVLELRSSRPASHQLPIARMFGEQLRKNIVCLFSFLSAAACRARPCCFPDFLMLLNFPTFVACGHHPGDKTCAPASSVCWRSSPHAAASPASAFSFLAAFPFSFLHAETSKKHLSRVLHLCFSAVWYESRLRMQGAGSLFRHASQRS